MSLKAFQDSLPEFDCFGCGPANAKGLRIKSFWDPDDPGVTVCLWEPEAHHTSGIHNVTNGGVLATVIDSHCIWTAIADAYRDEGREFGSAPFIAYVTGELSAIYRKPTPMDTTLVFRARVAATQPKGFVENHTKIVHCLVYAHGRLRVEGRVVAVRPSKNPFATV